MGGFFSWAAYGIGSLLLIWHIILIGYMYVLIGDTIDFAAYQRQLGMVLGFCMLGCAVLPIGVFLIVVYGLQMSIDATAILSIVIACLAVGFSVASMSIASITH